MAGVERMRQVWGNTVGAFEVARIRSIIVAVVATVAIIGQDEGAMDLENTVGSKYAKFRIYAVEGVTQ